MKLVFAVLLAVCVLFSGATASEDTSRAVREMAESLISSGQVVGTIQAAHAVVPIAELGASFVAIAETEDPVPLDLKYREPCKAGHACPIKNGHCCLNGTMCCPAGQPCQPTNPPTCGTSAMEKALLVAKAKIQQEVHLTTDEEQKAKKKSEAGKKAEIEGKEKARQERKDKRAKEHKEKNDAIIAAKNAQIEKMKQLAAAHAAKQADQRTKHKLKLAERSEKRKDKEEKGKEQRKKAEANKKAEARTKEARKKAEQASKESKTKSQEKARKKAAENRKKAANRIHLVHGFRAYGGSYRAPSVQRVGQFCFVSGLLRLGRYNTYVGRLPAKCRPQRRLLFKVNFGSGRRARLDVLKNGYMYWLKHDAGTSWLPLDGIQFSVTRGSTLRLGRHWRHYGYSYDHAQVRKEGNFCMVQGLVRWANYRWSTRAVAYLPSWCRPDRRLIFSAQHWGEQIRIDVLRDGRMYWIYKRTNTVWLSLAGINFFTKPGTQIRYANGWRAYGYYRTPSVYKQGKICSLSGLARSQYNRWGHMGYVPVACRPKKRLIFYGNNHGGHYREGRVDILPNGAIVWITGGRSHRWLSLSFNWLIY